MIDLRSDTVTLPSDEMRQAIHQAELGDDGYGEDPSVNALEALAADEMGKEAGLFVVSGTMGNLCAHLAHTLPGDEVICGELCHTIDSEQGGVSRVAGLSVRTISQSHATLDPAAIEAAIRPESVEYPRTGLIWVEQPQRGWVLPLSNLETIRELARTRTLPVHMDGARIYQAAIHLGIEVSAIASYVDSVMFCLSKDLGAPMGSVLVGDHDFIQRARRARNLLGGGTRQAGIVAAAGIYAIRHMTKRLREDQENAKVLAQCLREIPAIQVDRQEIQTNIFFIELQSEKIQPRALAAALRDRGILVSPRGETRMMRMVTHYGIMQEDVRYAASAMRELLQ